MFGMGRGRFARVRLTTGVAATALVTGLSATSASAQLVSTVPGVQTRIQADPNGVDLVTGVFTLRHVDLTFGPNAKTRLNVETQIGSGDGDNYSGYVFERVEGGISYVYTVRGSITKKFRVINGGYSPVDGSGATLSKPTATTYLLTESDGTRVEFLHQRYNTTMFNDASGTLDYINYIQYVDGERLTFATRAETQSWCEGDLEVYLAPSESREGAVHEPPFDLSNRKDTGGLPDKAAAIDRDGSGAATSGMTEGPVRPERCYQRQWRRVQSITSNLGHQLRFGYESDDSPPSDGGYNGFSTVKTVMAVNLGVDYCAPYASTCATTRAWPKLTYTARSTASQPGNTAYTDSLGRQWSVLTTYSGSGMQQIEVRRPSSSTPYIVASVTSGKVSSVQTPAGTWNYNWNTAGTVVVTDPLGRTRTVVSDTATGLITEDTNALGQTRRYAYDGFGRLVTATAPEGDSEEFQYDARGNITTRIRHAKPGSGAADITTTSSYPAQCTSVADCNLPVSSTDAKGNVTSFSWDPNHGGLTAVAAPAVNGVAAVTEYSYMPLLTAMKDASGNLVAGGGAVTRLSRISVCKTQASCVGTADQVVTTLSYGTSDRKLTQTTTSSGDGSLSRTTTASYDDFGNMVAVDGPLPGTDDTMVMRYDAAYRRIGVVAPDPDGAGPLARRAERTTYDVDDRVTSSESGLIYGTTDGDWNGFAPQQRALSTYDGRGFKTRDTVTAGGATVAVTGYGYDAMGRLVCTAQRMDPAQWDAQTDHCTPQTGGPNGPDRVTQAAYDELGRVTTIQSAFGTPAATIERQSYTANGQVSSVTDANSNTTQYGYDGHDRLATTTFPGGSYEALGYDGNDNVVSRRLRDGQVIGHDYDARNRRIRDDNPTTNPGTFAGDTDATYEYDLLGRMTFAGDANGWSTRWSYDALGQLTQQSSNVVTSVQSNTLQYDAAGRMVRQTYGDGFFVTYDYNTAGWVTAVRENGGLALASFGYDGFGRRTSIMRGNGTVSSYTYDAASRLTSLTQDLGGTASDLTLGFAFNPAGQITTRTSSNTGYAFANRYTIDRSYGVNALNQYTTAGNVAFTYDPRGNLSGDGSATYLYDTRNNLFKVRSGSGGARLYHSPTGLLDEVAGNTMTRFGYLGANLMTEVDGMTGALQRRYVHGPGTDAPLVWYEGGQRRYLHADERGSIVAVTGDAGNTIATNTYDEFGIPGANNVGRFQYTGQKWIPEVGLYDYKARMYSPTLGRFLQTDPIGYGDGLNMYNYVGGDPVNYTDPSGKCLWGIWSEGEKAYVMTKIFEGPCNGGDGGGGGGWFPGDGRISPGNGGGGGDGGSRGGSTAPAPTPTPKPEPARQKSQPTRSVTDCLGQTARTAGGGLALDLAGVGLALAPPAKAAVALGGLAVGAAAMTNSSIGADAVGFSAGLATYGFAAAGPEASRLSTAAVSSRGRAIASSIPGVGLALAVGALGYDSYNAYQSYNQCRRGQ